MKRMTLLKVWLLAIFFGLSVLSTSAQVPTSTINGIVRDPHQAGVAGANITATNSATSATRTTISNSDGLYSIPDLPPGSYTVRVEFSGFAPSDFSGVVLEAGRVTTINADLKI